MNLVDSLYLTDSSGLCGRIPPLRQQHRSDRPAHRGPRDTLGSVEVPVVSPHCEGELLDGLPMPLEVPTDEQQRYLEMHGFEKALQAGYFEWDEVPGGPEKASDRGVLA
jgi:hypothetical protein